MKPLELNSITPIRGIVFGASTTVLYSIGAYIIFSTSFKVSKTSLCRCKLGSHQKRTKNHSLPAMAYSNLRI